MPSLVPNEPLGRIDPGMLIGHAPGVTTPAVTALSDAMRQGQISADDVIERYGQHAKLKQSIEDQLLKEVGSPEQVAQRQTAVQANTLQNQNAIANAPLAGEAQKDSLLASIFKAQAQPGNYEAKLDALNKAGATLSSPPQLESGLTPEQRQEIDDKFGSVQRWGMQQSQAAAYVQASKEVPVKSTDKYGNEVTVTKIRDPFGAEIDPQKYRDIAMFAASPYTVWKAHGEPLFSSVLAPGQSTEQPAVNNPQVTPSAATVSPTVTPSAGAGGAPSRADFISPAVTPKTAPVAEKPSVLPPPQQIVTETKAAPAKEIQAGEAEVRKQLTSDEGFKAWTKAAPEATKLRTAAERFSKISVEDQRLGKYNLNIPDIEIAAAFIKQMDPEAVIREFKWEKLAGAGSIDERLKNAVSTVLHKGTFTPETRQEIINTGLGMFDARTQDVLPKIAMAKKIVDDTNGVYDLKHVLTADEIAALNKTPAGATAFSANPNPSSSNPPVTLPNGKRVMWGSDGRPVLAQ